MPHYTFIISGRMMVLFAIIYIAIGIVIGRLT